MKKFTTLALAGVMSMAMATNVFADKVITTSATGATVDNGNFVYDLINLGLDYENATSVTLTFTASSLDAGFGGAFVLNCDESNWDAVEWGNDSAGKEITAVATDNEMEFTITREIPAELFTSAEDPTNGNYAQVCLQSWWGADLNITDVTITYADGTTTSSNAGDTSTPVVYLAAAAALAGLALVVTRKKMA